VCCRTEAVRFELYIYLRRPCSNKRPVIREFELRNETMIKKRPKGINWHTAIFMGLLHVGAVAALFAHLWGGGHNNHHAHPTAARHGLAWHEIDINWWGIRVMQFLGLARAIKLVSLAQRFLT
jgi:hypothetical protein